MHGQVSFHATWHEESADHFSPCFVILVTHLLDICWTCVYTYLVLVVVIHIKQFVDM